MVSEATRHLLYVVGGMGFWALMILAVCFSPKLGMGILLSVLFVCVVMVFRSAPRGSFPPLSQIVALGGASCVFGNWIFIVLPIYNSCGGPADPIRYIFDWVRGYTATTELVVRHSDGSFVSSGVREPPNRGPSIDLHTELARRDLLQSGRGWCMCAVELARLDPGPKQWRVYDISHTQRLVTPDFVKVTIDTNGPIPPSSAEPIVARRLLIVCDCGL